MSEHKALEIRVSVDVGCHSHNVAMGLSSGEVLEEFQIAHGPEGFKYFFGRIERQQKKRRCPVAVAMEGYNGYARPLDAWTRGRTRGRCDFYGFSYFFDSNSLRHRWPSRIPRRAARYTDSGLTPNGTASCLPLRPRHSTHKYATPLPVPDIVLLYDLPLPRFRREPSLLDTLVPQDSLEILLSYSYPLTHPQSAPPPAASAQQTPSLPRSVHPPRSFLCPSGAYAPPTTPQCCESVLPLETPPASPFQPPLLHIFRTELWPLALSCQIVPTLSPFLANHVHVCPAAFHAHYTDTCPIPLDCEPHLPEADLDGDIEPIPENMAPPHKRLTCIDFETDAHCDDDDG